MPSTVTERSARLSIDLSKALRRRIRFAAAHHDTSIRDYVVEAVLARLTDDEERAGLVALREAADPVLSALWKNDADAVYDEL